MQPDYERCSYFISIFCTYNLTKKTAKIKSMGRVQNARRKIPKYGMICKNQGPQWEWRQLESISKSESVNFCKEDNEEIWALDVGGKPQRGKIHAVR